MCNHYQTSHKVPEWAMRTVPRLALVDAFDTSEQIFPKYPAPVVIQQGGESSLVIKKWGIPIQIKGKTKPLTKFVTNARNDKLGSYPWRFSVGERRCLIPASGYFEPGDGPVGRKGEIFFSVKDQPFFFFAGLWDGDHFTMVTTDPNDYVAQYHDRMPVILAPSLASDWLGDEPLAEELLHALCQGLPTEALEHKDIAARTAK